MKSKLAVDFADLVYNGKWFTPLREALSAAVYSAHSAGSCSQGFSTLLSTVSISVQSLQAANVATAAQKARKRIIRFGFIFIAITCYTVCNPTIRGFP